MSLFRDGDRTLIAGDAFVDVKQESLYRVVLQTPELNGPPKYMTTDWRAAHQSVRTLAALRPAYALTGHGRPLGGSELTGGLDRLAANFEELAVPDHGRHVDGEDA